MTLKSPPKQSQMHGDLVHALAATACARWYTHKAIAWYHRDADLVNPPIPSYVPWCLCLGMAGSACVCYYSWINNHCSASAMAFAVATLTFAGIDVYNWPQPEDNTAVNRFVWLLLICTANQPHSFASKMIMGVGATIVYTTVSAISPLYTTGENVPIMFACFGTTLRCCTCAALN
jgi:hypothetical protein